MPDFASRPHVLIVGAAGVFGSRLARLLARRGAFRVTLGGRTPDKVSALRPDLLRIDPHGGFDFAKLDRDSIDPTALREIGCAAVVDCSGPFQQMGTNLIDTAIAAGCHYVDLADSRAFIADIGRFDAAAKAAGVAVITGASSTPGLSNAVLDELLAGWRSIDSIDCAIFPGNQTPKGRSVISGILSWVGQPSTIFREGGWQVGTGWSRMRTVVIAGVGPRRVGQADVPDLDIVPARFAPRIRAGFDAGMELPILNGLISLSALAVRWRLIGSARILTGIGTLIANSLDRFGSADGGMLVEASGTDRHGASRQVRWSLRAASGDGPYVPVGPAAAVLEKLLMARSLPTGASSAAGCLTLSDIKPHYAGLAIDMAETAGHTAIPVYRQVMGDAFALLPETTRRIHRGLPAILARGEATITPARALVGRLMARLFGMPTAAGTVPLRVIIESRDGREYWTRVFGDTFMRSTMRARGGLIEERFGPVAIRMRLAASAEGLDMHPVGGSLLGLPLPGFLLPSITAQERVDAEGRHLFHVDIGLPLVGRLVAYQGQLTFE